jgi:hypothetical protein
MCCNAGGPVNQRSLVAALDLYNFVLLIEKADASRERAKSLNSLSNQQTKFLAVRPVGPDNVILRAQGQSLSLVRRVDCGEEPKVTIIARWRWWINQTKLALEAKVLSY